MNKTHDTQTVTSPYRIHSMYHADVFCNNLADTNETAKELSEKNPDEAFVIYSEYAYANKELDKFTGAWVNGQYKSLIVPLAQTMGEGPKPGCYALA